MTYIFAHRGGGTNKNRENTLEAFLNAKKLGADWVEFDLRRSQDGTLVVHHDAQLSDGRLIAETSSTDLPDYIPSLAEALEACDGLGVNIEIKNAPTEPDFDPNHEIAAAVAGIVSAYLDYEKLIVSSFNFDTLANIKDCDASIPTGLLFFDPLTAGQNIERVREAEYFAIHPHISSVDDSFMKDARGGNSDSRLAVNVWGVNNQSQIEEMLELGVDGIITDEPELARKIVSQREAA